MQREPLLHRETRVSEQLEQPEADQIDSETAQEEVVEETKETSPPKISGAHAIGKLAGASVAIPTAAIVFCVAAMAGVPASTAITRSVFTAIGMWIFVGLAFRFLFTFVIYDWRKKMSPSPAANEGASE